jgi:hypothetical protein
MLKSNINALLNTLCVSFHILMLPFLANKAVVSICGIFWLDFRSITRSLHLLYAIKNHPVYILKKMGTEIKKCGYKPQLILLHTMNLVPSLLAPHTKSPLLNILHTHALSILEKFNSSTILCFMDLSSYLHFIFRHTSSYFLSLTITSLMLQI